MDVNVYMARVRAKNNKKNDFKWITSARNCARSVSNSRCEMSKLIFHDYTAAESAVNHVDTQEQRSTPADFSVVVEKKEFRNDFIYISAIRYKLNSL